jgi:DNA repair exonuclease SbcCD ATPase subunit
MSVYEWYVENAFSPMVNGKSEKGDTFNSERVKYVDIDSEEFIEQLKEEKKQLENQLINMQEELNLVYGKITELTNEIQKLKEENAFLIELYEQIDEMYQELKKTNQQESSNETSKKLKRKLNKAMSLEDFKMIFTEIINEYESETVDILQQKEELLTSEIYELFFNKDEQLRNEIILNEEYCCPLTGRKYKNLKSMIKNAIYTKLEKVINQSGKTLLTDESTH